MCISSDNALYTAYRRNPGGAVSAGRFVATTQHSTFVGDGKKFMPNSFTRVALSLVTIGGMFTHSFFLGSAAAQKTEAVSQQTVEVPLSQLNEIQQELRYLRERDAERQDWEESISKRLPHAEVDSSNPPAATQDSVPLPSSGDGIIAGDCISQCGCHPCQCPLPPASCLDCPHVSTLSPYFNVRVFGALKLDMLFNDARPVAPGVPFFLAPDSLTGLSQNNLDIHARQTTLGAAFDGPKIGNFQSGGMLLGMLFSNSVIDDRYGFLPLQAYGDLKNEDWRFAAGLQFDVFAPGMPTILPFSALAASGNAGNSFRGSLRLERFLRPSDNVQWTLQGALSEPITTTISPTFAINEDNGWPNVEGRLALGLGMPEQAGLVALRPFEIGVSGVVGQIRNTLPLSGSRVVEDVWGLAVDSRWKINSCFGIMGEVYTGQTLGTYNGGILQNVNPDTLEGIRSTGGFMEVFTYLTPRLHNHTGYGIDDPRNRDIGTSAASLGRTLNSTIYSNLLWDVNQTFRVGFEFTWRETNYSSAVNPNNEGAGFHTQFQWAF